MAMLRPTKGVYDEGSALNRFFKPCEMSRSDRSSISLIENMLSRFFPLRVGQEIDADVEKSADRGILKRRINDIFRED